MKNLSWLKSPTQLYAVVISVISIASLVYIYTSPPDSLRVTRDGVPHFTPRVAHPDTGEALDVGALVRHFKGE